VAVPNPGFTNWLGTLTGRGSNRRLLLALAALALPLALAAETPYFTPGNLAVLRVGDGTQALTNAGNTVYLDQFTPAGTLVNRVAVPDTGGSALLVSGTANSG
jgi:hypothetical protein